MAMASNRHSNEAIRVSKNKSIVVRSYNDAIQYENLIKASLEMAELDWSCDLETPILGLQNNKKNLNIYRQHDLSENMQQYDEYVVIATKSRDPFSLLSDEVMLKIFSYLPMSSICKCVQVSTRWKCLGYDKQFWRIVNLDCKKIRTDGWLGALLHRGVKILRLSRSEVMAAVCDEAHFSLDMGEICRRFSLTHLDASITKFENDRLADLLFKCRSLCNLSLEGCKITVPDVTAISLNSELRVLNLANVHGLTLPQIDAITRSCTKLRVLNLAWTNQTRDAVQHISRLNQLEELNVSGLRGGIDRIKMELLVTRCRQLRCLDLSDVTLQIGTLKLIADNCRLLQKLCISRCTDVRAEQLFELVSLPNLSNLNLFGFNNTDALRRFTSQRPDIYLNKETFSPIARPISTARYEGRLWEQYVGFII